MDGFAHLDAIGQAELVRTGHATVLELVDAAIARIEALNPALNAVVHRCFEQARETAVRLGMSSTASTSPLHGAPFLLKDVAPGQAGIPLTLANAALKARKATPTTDSPLGQRFREAGLVTLGVTNAPEFGLLGDTQPIAYGPTRNPWALDRSPSGSSGGAGAAVAAGMVPIAQGGDAAGSSRGPAAWCGIVGLKVSRGRVPRPVARIDDLFSSQLVLTRTVRDTAAALDAVHGALPGDLFAQPPPATSYLHALSTPPRALRVGMLTHGPDNIEMHPECVRAVERTARLLQDAGHEVDAHWPGAFLEEVPQEVNRLRDAVIFHDVIGDLATTLGRQVRQDDVEPYTWYRYQHSEPASADDLRAGLAWHVARGARMLEWWATGFDLLITPVLNEPAQLLADLAAEDPAQMAVTERRHALFLEPFNASGQPAISVPVHWTPEGLPVGVQIAADRGREDLLLQVAAQLEQLTNWANQWPELRTDG